MKFDLIQFLTILFIIVLFWSEAAELRKPGKPRLTNCRSPEKETFTCWWEPGDDGGIHTTYRLYYRLEGSETVFQCSDYKTSGPNSCFFNKNETTLWVTYNITVVATNAVGSSISEPVEVDVVYIVQPNTPDRVRTKMLDDVNPPYLRVFWDKPRLADTRSGWITLIYQLRIKQTKEENWEDFDAGMQKYYDVFCPHSGKQYMVQVRCKPDHGFWSEWSETVFIQIPDYMPPERNMWVMLVIFSAFIILILIWIMSIKCHSVKRLLLPPVPGPKIKGLDQQLLQSGRSEEAFSSLLIQSFPPTSYEELLIEYLEVYDDKDLHRFLHDFKDAPEPKSVQSDSDSGRGSCDSRTLLMEKSSGDEGGAEATTWVSMKNQNFQDAEMEGGKLQLWSDTFSSPVLQPPGGTGGTNQRVPEISCVSQNVQVSRNHYHHHHPYSKAQRQVSECTQYVEVQTTDQENILLLQPLCGSEVAPAAPLDLSAAQSYSRVQDVTSDDAVLLQRAMSLHTTDYCQCLSQITEVCPENQLTCKSGPLPLSSASPSLMILEGMRLGRSGYVDSSGIFFQR